MCPDGLVQVSLKSVLRALSPCHLSFSLLFPFPLSFFNQCSFIPPPPHPHPQPSVFCLWTLHPSPRLPDRDDPSGQMSLSETGSLSLGFLTGQNSEILTSAWNLAISFPKISPCSYPRTQGTLRQLCWVASFQKTGWLLMEFLISNIMNRQLFDF